MKKKTLGIVISVIIVSLLLSLVAVGALLFLRDRNVEETGNVLGVAWYNPADTEFTITTKEELYEFAKLSDYYDFKDQTIYLGADIVVNEGNATEWKENAPKTKWTPISGFAGTFDGQGHTISGIYGKSYEAPMALFTNAKYSCTVKNMKLVNSYFSTRGNGGTASFVSNGGGKFLQLYSDAIFDHTGELCGGIASRVDAQSTFEECWFDGEINVTSRNVGGIIDHVSGARVTVRHCLFSGDINQKYSYNGTRTGGICGRVSNMGALLITDCLSSGKMTTAKESEIGAMIGKSESGVEVTVTDSYTSKETHPIVVGSKAGTYSGNGIGIYGDDLVGMKAYQWTSLDFENYWAVVEDDTPILKYFADTVPSVEGIAKCFDTSWYNSGTTSFTITTKEQLYGFYYISMKDTFAGKTVKLGADIVINEGNAKNWAESTPEDLWYPINAFTGTFDGQGHTISGICLKENTSASVYSGLFAQTQVGSMIKNFQIKNSYLERMVTTVNSGAFLGSAAGEIRGSIDSVYSDAILVSNGQQVGGIVGRINYMDKSYTKTLSINNCWFDGEITGIKNQKMGGIVSYAGKGSAIDGTKVKMEITHCLNSGTINNDRISNKDTFSGAQYIGGILGFDNATITLKVEDTLNVGKLNLKYTGYAGSFTGRIKSKNSVYTITDTYTAQDALRYNGGLPLQIHDITGTMIGGPAAVPNETLIGANAYKYTTLDFSNYWTIVDGSTPVLKIFATKTQSTSGITKMVDTSWYDPAKDTYVIDSAADLYGFYVVSTFDDFKGKTIKLGADITMNTGNAADWAKNAPEHEWYAVGGYNRTNYLFAGTFDGQGHTISGLYFKEDTDSGKYFSGFFGITDVGAVIKNFSLKNSYFERIVAEDDKGAFLGSIAGESRGTIDSVYSNAILSSNGQQVGGIVGRMNCLDKEGKVTVTANNCWFDGSITADGNRRIGGIVAYVGRGSGVKAENTKLVISNCLYTGTIDSTRKSAPAVAGILAYDNAAVNLTMTSCLSNGEIKVKSTGYVASVIAYQNKAGSVYTIKDTYGTEECYSLSDGTIRGIHTYNGTINGGVATLPEDMIIGDRGYKFTNLDFANYWAVIGGTTPELKSFSGAGSSVANIKKMVDTDWFDASKKTLEIDSAAELYGLREIATYHNFAGQTIEVKADITIPSGNPWYPIANTRTFSIFMGTFDGQGHTISGLNLKDDASYLGLFGITGIGSMVKDFRLTDSTFECTSGGRIGSIIGDMRGSLETVYSDATVISSGSGQVGGLVGIANYQDIEHTKDIVIRDCWFDGEVRTSGKAYQVGGIAGSVGRGGSGYTASKSIIRFEHCLVTGDIYGACTGDYQYTGGIFGDSNKANVRVYIDDCLMAGTIDVTNHEGVGSLVGAFRNSGSVCYITNTSVTNESYEDEEGNNLSVDQNITDQTTGSIEDGYNYVSKNAITGVGAIQTNIDLIDWWTARTNGIPVLRSFVDAETDKLITFNVEWYSDEADEFVIKSVDEFYGFTLLAKTKTFDNKTVYLGTDIVLNDETQGTADTWGTTPPENAWAPIGTTSSMFAGTFNGKDPVTNVIHSISGVYIKNNNSNLGLFGITDVGSKICNIKLLNSYIESVGGTRVGSIVGDMRGKVDTVYSDAYVVTNLYQAGGLVGAANYQDKTGDEIVQIDNSWFAGTLNGTDTSFRLGGIAGVVAKGGDKNYPTSDIRITNCLMTGSIIRTGENNTGYDYLAVGGLIGDNNAGNVTLTVDGCVMAAETITVEDHTAVGALFGAIYNKKCNYTMSNTYALKGSYSENELIGKRPGKTDATEGATSSYTFKNKADMLGFKALQTLSLDFVDTWAALNGQVPALKSFIGTNNIVSSDLVVSYDISWYTGEENATYTLDTLSELYGFAQLSQAEDFAGDTILLGKDIVLNTGDAETFGVTAPNNVWTPIGYMNTNDTGTETSVYGFCGTFDGQGHSISGLYLKSDDNYGMGFIAMLGTNGKVRNLKLTNSYFEVLGAQRVGSIVGEARGTNIEIDSVYSDAIIKSNQNRIGGLVGVLNTKGTINVNNSWFDGKVIIGEAVADTDVGGIVGALFSGNNVHITNCLFSGTIDITGAGKSIGGIVGRDNAAAVVAEIRNCLSVGTIDADDCTYVSGILGRARSGKYSIYNSYGLDGLALWQENFKSGAYVKTPDELSKTIAKESILGTLATTNLADLMNVIDTDGNAVWATDTQTKPDGSTPILATFSEWWIAKKLAETGR